MIDLITLSLFTLAYIVGGFTYFKSGNILLSVFLFVIIQLTYVFYGFYWLIERLNEKNISNCFFSFN